MLKYRFIQSTLGVKHQCLHEDPALGCFPFGDTQVSFCLWLRSGSALSALLCHFIFIVHL